MEASVICILFSCDSVMLAPLSIKYIISRLIFLVQFLFDENFYANSPANSTASLPPHIFLDYVL